MVATVLGWFLDDVNLQWAGASRVISLESEGLFSRRINYFDFIVPGIMGMGVMILSITFLAASVSQYREQKILRRMLATPLRVHKFLIA